MPCNVESLLTSSIYPALNATNPNDLVFWTKNTLYEWAHDAVQRLARAAAGLIFTDTRAIATGTADYLLPARTLSVLHVTAAGRTLRPANARDLEARSSTWRAAEGVVISHYIRQDQGLMSIKIYPKPATGLTGAVRATVHLLPPVVSDSAPTVAWPEALGGYIALRTIAAARTAETEAKMPEAAAVAAEIGLVYEQIALKLWGGVQ